MTPKKGLYIPERKGAPETDPAVVAAKKLQEASAALFALPANNYADEQKPEYKAALKREKEADDAFSAASVTSLAGALIKLRALAKDIVEDSGTDAWNLGHVKTVTAFLEGLAGAPSVADDGHPDAALLALWKEWVPLMDRLNDPRTSDDEGDALGEQTWEIERRIIDTTPQTPVGLMVPVKLLARYQEIGPEFTDHRERDLGRNILAAFGRLTPGLAEIGWGPSIVIDPAVAALAEYRVANAALEAFPDDEAEADTPEYEAAGARRYAARGAVYDVVPTSMAGMAAKVRFIVDHEERGNDLWVPFDAMAKSMLPFLEGGAAVAPPTVTEPDPVVTLFAEWGTIQDEATALSAANPEAKSGELNDRWEAALDRRDVVGDKIMSTPATSIKGVAVKVRLTSHYAFDIVELATLHRTPSRDIDYGGEHGAGDALNDYLVSALRDAERLAGV